MGGVSLHSSRCIGTWCAQERAGHNFLATGYPGRLADLGKANSAASVHRPGCSSVVLMFHGKRDSGEDSDIVKELLPHRQAFEKVCEGAGRVRDSLEAAAASKARKYLQATQSDTESMYKHDAFVNGWT